jgi:hypothetical protein
VGDVVPVVKRLALLALLVAAAPAWSARTWSDAEPVASPVPDYAAAAVGSDGTTVTAWTVDDDSPGGYSVFARAGSAAPVRVGATGSESLRVGAGPGGQGIVLWAATGSDGAVVTLAVYAQPGGTFSAPATIGAGAPFALATNAAGDAAVILQQTLVFGPTDFGVRDSTAFRPAGGTFGPAVALPDTLIGSFTLSPSGETVVAQGLNGHNAPTLGVKIVTRVRDGALTTPVQLTSDGQNSSVVADARGRVLALWTIPDRTAFFTAVRTEAGAWSTPIAHELPAQEAGYAVGVSDAGEALLAYREAPDASPFASPFAGALRLSTASLGDGELSAPALLDPRAGSLPYLATAADGTTVIASTDAAAKRVRVVRRAGTGDFGDPQTAGCDDGSSLRGIAGLTTSGGATLLIGSALTRDAAASSAEPVTCPPPALRTPTPSPSPTAGASPTAVADAEYSTDPVVANEPVTITATVRRAGTTDVYDYRFDLDGDGRADHATGGSGVVSYTFTRPGRRPWSLTTQQTASDGTRADFTDRFKVDVFARPTLRAARTQPRARVLRHGLRVRANAFTGAQRELVTVTVRGRGHRLARRVVRLGARPKPEAIRLSRRGRAAVRRHRRTAVTIALAQDRRRLRTTRVRVVR